MTAPASCGVDGVGFVVLLVVWWGGGVAVVVIQPQLWRNAARASATMTRQQSMMMMYAMMMAVFTPSRTLSLYQRRASTAATRVQPTLPAVVDISSCTMSIMVASKPKNDGRT